MVLDYIIRATAQWVLQVSHFQVTYCLVPYLYLASFYKYYAQNKD